MPSSSARCAQLPRAADKVPFYIALRKLKDYLNGIITELDEEELIFTDDKLKQIGNAAMKFKDDLDMKPDIKNEPLDEDVKNSVFFQSGLSIPIKKKRGRPRKTEIPGEPSAPRPKRRPAAPADPNAPKKKRGRPRKIRPEEVGNPQQLYTNCGVPPWNNRSYPPQMAEQNYPPPQMRVPTVTTTDSSRCHPTVHHLLTTATSLLRSSSPTTLTLVTR